jgi:hypothetical protein
MDTAAVGSASGKTGGGFQASRPNRPKMVPTTTVLGDGWPGPTGSWVGNLQERNTILPQFVTGSFKERHILLTALERVASAQQVSEAGLVATNNQATQCFTLPSGA